MNTKRIEEIQKETAYPDSISEQLTAFAEYCKNQRRVQS